MPKEIYPDFAKLTQKIINSTETQVFVLTTHLGADFDDFSSLVAFLDYLNHLKPSLETHICLSGELDPKYLALTPSSSFFWKDSDFADFTDYFKADFSDKNIYLSVFGCSDLKRTLGNPYTQAIYQTFNGQTNFQTISFDHHIQGEAWADYNFVDDQASSNAENLLDVIFQQSNFKISPDTATNLMIGLVSDTVNFFASSTTNLTHKHAGELMNLGCNIALVRAIIHEKWTVENLSRLNDLISKTEYLDTSTLTWHKDNLNTSFAVLDCGLDSEIPNLFSNEILDILKTQIVIMVKVGTGPKDRKLSIRCLPDSPLNAVDLASHFGGGGHRLAAGGSIGNHDINWFKGELVQFLKKSKI